MTGQEQFVVSVLGGMAGAVIVLLVVEVFTYMASFDP